MFPITFSSTLSPTFSDLMRNIWDGAVDPSASLNNRLPRKSVSLIVPARINVITTSAGTVTSVAPLSMVKASCTALFTVLAYWMRRECNKGG